MRIIISILILFSAVICIISNQLSIKISRPVEKITEIFNNINLDSINSLSVQEFNTGSRINEVNSLYNSF